jgi:RNA polymerase subunit RPABC4/transcription elongation factor Spt4
MAETKMRECKKCCSEIEANLNKCPYCGASTLSNAVTLIALAVIILVVAGIYSFFLRA